MVTSTKRNPSDPWIPDRQDIIWIDCNPQAGQEMRDFHPFLVLSPRNFNDKTSLVIGLPMTTADYNASNPFAVAIGQVSRKQGKQAMFFVIIRNLLTGGLVTQNHTP